MSSSLSAEAEINIRYPSRNPSYCNMSVLAIANCFGEIFHIFPPMHIKATAGLWPMWDTQIFPRYDVVAGLSWNFQCMCIDTVNVPRWAETAQNVSAPTISFRHLHLEAELQSVDLFIVQAKMGPRNLFIWLARIVQQFEERSLSKRFTESSSTSKALTYLSYSSPAFKQCVFSERTE